MDALFRWIFPGNDHGQIDEGKSQRRGGSSHSRGEEKRIVREKSMTESWEICVDSTSSQELTTYVSPPATTQYRSTQLNKTIEYDNKSSSLDNSAVTRSPGHPPSCLDPDLMAHLRESLNLQPKNEKAQVVHWDLSQEIWYPNVIDYMRRRLAAEEERAEEARANAILDNLDQDFAPTIKSSILDSRETGEDET